jgi:methylglutamate dehydrogenase subunit C
MTGFRLDAGGRIDRLQSCSFTFDGAGYTGCTGDTLASALVANGVRLFGRSFKLHRPRGLVSAGPDEPNALMAIGARGQHFPNVPATTVELADGLSASSQNRWPSLRFDALAVNNALSAFLGPGFYYKTFMWPSALWEKFYEPAIRRAAGLGTLGNTADPGHYDHVHHHCDVLVVGSGAAGLAAAHAATLSGARVILAEQDFIFGGGTLLEPTLDTWRAAALAALTDATLLARTSVVGAYGHGVFAAVQRRHGSTAQTLHIIRAKQTILATGSTERLIAFPGNDRPGVMMAGAVRTYADRFAVACGRRVAFFVNNDEAYAAIDSLVRHGVEIAAIVDPRPQSIATDAAKAKGYPVYAAHAVTGTIGRQSLTAIHVRPVAGGVAKTIDANVLAMSGGHNPQVQLASQARVPLVWSDAIAAFVPGATSQLILSAGAANGIFGIHEAAADGLVKARAALSALGRATSSVTLPGSPSVASTPIFPLWEVLGTGKAFVDLQHDVTTADIRLAHQEGYSHVEHMKRYTTHGMGTDQGGIGGLVGSAVLASARGVSVAEVGLPTFRPYAGGASWGALAGPGTGLHFKPERRLPLHDWHAANGAVFVRIGLWMRPLVYSPPGDTSWGPVLEEARAVRCAVGITDVSSLGKIDVQGPDAAVFLDRIYANTFSTLPVGRARYGLMLREDGMVLDDGTTTRLAQNHFLITTTTQKADDVLAHMEWYRDTVWPELDVVLTNVADHWAQFAIAGPLARKVLEAAAPATQLNNETLPFMAAGNINVADVPGRVFRISFSGELAYEVAVPARHALGVWTTLLDAGKPYGVRPYGLDALNVLRIEKGHVTGAEINGQTTAADLGLEKMLKRQGDFVGRVLSQRAGLLEPQRLQLVGLRAIEPSQRIRGGAHLVGAGHSGSQGYITSPCMAAGHDGWIALALLESGKARHGERLVATSPVFGEEVLVEVVSPHVLDPENARVRS